MPIERRASAPGGRGRLGEIAVYTVMVLVTISSLLPFVWAFLTSLKVERQVYAFPPQLLPDPVTSYNYLQAINHGLLLALFNCLVISLATVGLVLAFGSLAAYPLARMTFPGSQVVLFLILVPMMIPGLVNLVPTYIIMAKLGLLDSYHGLIPIYWVHSLPLAIWVLRGFFHELPRELEDAASVDGASRLRILWSIIIPLSQPALAAVALLVFLNSWNEFVIASIVTSSALMRTAQVFLYLNMTDVGVNWVR
ncbi:MAG: carbohydrate ABC transporter permease [Propionibacteriaceae bacterium]|nr:carbohydrate ABC transporter permease [Propionibacteriaceae bacterium]